MQADVHLALFGERVDVLAQRPARRFETRIDERLVRAEMRHGREPRGNGQRIGVEGAAREDATLLVRPREEFHHVGAPGERATGEPPPIALP